MTRSLVPARLASALLLLLLTNTAPASVLERWFAPKAELWSFWAAEDASSSARIEHGPWDRFLQSYVHRHADGISRVDYSAVMPQDRRELNGYITRLESVAIRGYARPEQLAYWINLYNAATVALVLDHYPVASIRDIDISPGLFSLGPWDSKRLEVEGQALSLNDIEHRILRPIWQDPRLHYLLNCASLGCPNLHDRAYTTANLPALMDENARAYINHPRSVEIVDGKARVSSIYNWFSADFGTDQQAVLTHIRQYAAPELAQSLAPVSAIRGYGYDWALNDHTAR
jgi:hypothetical protein